MPEVQEYYELKIKINPEIADIISEICFDYFNCEGIVLAEEKYKDLEMVSTTEGTLKAFVKSTEDIKKVLEENRELLKTRGFSDEELGSWEYSCSKVENEDWSKKWKEQWDVTHVSDRITVVPNWIDYTPKDKEIIINIDPGCAFGTGTHSTTQLCLRALEKYMHKGDRVADIGMGSGILAICAKKLGASYVYGCDNDETVIETAIENAAQNGVECLFELDTTDKIKEKFNFVCANILHNVLAAIMGDLKNIMCKNAVMALSGILDEKKQVVLDVINMYNFKLIEEIQQEQWIAFIVKRID